jgi:hypothetical protein
MPAAVCSPGMRNLGGTSSSHASNQRKRQWLTRRCGVLMAHTVQEGRRDAATHLLLVLAQERSHASDTPAPPSLPLVWLPPAARIHAATQHGLAKRVPACTKDAVLLSGTHKNQERAGGGLRGVYVCVCVCVWLHPGSEHRAPRKPTPAATGQSTRCPRPSEAHDKIGVDARCRGTTPRCSRTT